MKKVVFSAPGSVILSGEYGILFGKPALILAIDKGVQVALTETKKHMMSKQYVQEADAIVKKYLKEKNQLFNEKIFRVTVQSNLPRSEFFGYSNALYSALISALLTLYTQKKYSRDEINILTYQLEKKFNSKSYGIRTSASTFGGLLYFRKEFEFLRTISLLHVRIPEYFEKHLFILKEISLLEQADKIPDIIRKEYNTKTSLIEQLLIEQEKITKRIVVSLFKEDVLLFKECLIKKEELEKKLYPHDRISKIVFREDIFEDSRYIPCKQALSGVAAL